MSFQESARLPDLSLLRENIFLTEEQVVVVKATISSTQVLIAGLDKKILEIENELFELRKQRNAAVETLAVPIALLAPVRKLPPEVLGEIFEQCVPIEPPHITPFDCRDAPLLLTHVCHRWRKVAQGTPRMWNRLILYNRIPEAFYLSIWLQNSGSFPLDITVDKYRHRPVSHNVRRSNRPVGNQIDPVYTGHGWRMDRYMVWLWLEAELDQSPRTVVEQFYRIRRLSLARAVAGELGLYFPTETTTSIPLLQELYVNCPRVGSADIAEHSLRNILTPQLHTLVLHGGADFLLPALKSTSNLRKLDIESDCTLDMFIDFVSLCPLLEHIDAFQIEARPPREPMDMNLITLFGLSHFGLGVYEREIDEDDLTKSLAKFRTPYLQSTELRRFPQSGGHILAAWMSDSHSRLHTVTFQNMLLESSVFSDLKAMFVDVKKLKLVACEMNVGFWKSLTPTGQDNPDMWIFPKLETLILESAYMEEEDEMDLVKLIERRAPPARAGEQVRDGVPYLVEVFCVECTFSLETYNALGQLRDVRDIFFIRVEE